MSYFKELKQEKEALKERFELAAEKLERIVAGEIDVEEIYINYFLKMAEFLLFLREIAGKASIWGGFHNKTCKTTCGKRTRRIARR